MADGSPAGKWTQAAAGLAASGKMDEACKTFKAAVEKWCTGDPTTMGKKFADVFYETANGALGKIDRETPILTAGSGGGASAMGTLEQIAGDETSPDQALAATLLQGRSEVPMIGGTSAMTNNANFDMLRGLWGSGEAGVGKGLNFADGQFPDKQLLELKSPLDKFQPGQDSRYNNVSMAESGKPLATVSCETCESDYCSDEGKKKCANQRAKAVGALLKAKRAAAAAAAAA